MDKLELKHLAPHLPYGLKCHSIDDMDDNPSERIFTLTGTSCVNVPKYTPSPIFKNIGIERYVQLTDGKFYHNKVISEFRPLMFPLSAITKEITISGKTFIPLLRLLSERYVINYESNILKDAVYSVEKFGSEVRVLFDNRVFEFQFFSDEYMIDKNENWVIERLIQWHFDIDGLIENKLAIDVTTLKENPYK